MSTPSSSAIRCSSPAIADGEAAPGANGAQAADKPAEAGEIWNGSDGAPNGEAKTERAEDHIDDTSAR